MDRFIVNSKEFQNRIAGNLKSNMDRFIEPLYIINISNIFEFKIQYG